MPSRAVKKGSRARAPTKRKSTKTKPNPPPAHLDRNHGKRASDSAAVTYTSALVGLSRPGPTGGYPTVHASWALAPYSQLYVIDWNPNQAIECVYAFDLSTYGNINAAAVNKFPLIPAPGSQFIRRQRTVGGCVNLRSTGPPLYATGQIFVAHCDPFPGTEGASVFVQIAKTSPSSRVFTIAEAADHPITAAARSNGDNADTYVKPIAWGRPSWTDLVTNSTMAWKQTIILVEGMAATDRVSLTARRYVEVMADDDSIVGAMATPPARSMGVVESVLTAHARAGIASAGHTTVSAIADGTQSFGGKSKNAFPIGSGRNYQ